MTNSVDDIRWNRMELLREKKKNDSEVETIQLYYLS